MGLIKKYVVFVLSPFILGSEMQKKMPDGIFFEHYFE